MSNLSDVLSAPINLPNEIPNDWRWRNIVDVCQPKQWKTISQQDLTLTGFPVFGANGFIGYFKEFNHAEETIAVTCRGATCGTVNLVPPKTYITGNAMCFDDVASNTSKKFLYYASIYRTLTDAISGSAQPQITGESLKFVKLPFPPLPEQKKIASILTSVDDVIETTQKQIDKLQDLKKATMNELLTKGIGHTEFKDSVLGRIPKSWEVVSVLDSNISVLDGDRGNEYPKEKDFTKSGYCLFLSAKNVTKNGFRFNETAFISKDKDEKLRKGRLNRNDVIITTRGTVGNIAQYDTNIPFNVVRINSGMAIIRNQEKRLSSDYLYHILSSEIITQQIENLTFGSAQPQLTIGTLNELKIPIPQISEQLKIVHIFSSILKEVQNKKQKLDQTQSLKKSLMQDLLTGKVRVQVH